MIPASALFLHSDTATYICLVVLFVVSTWNGATFYVEVFGRKFARELEQLRKEMDAMSAGTSNSSSAPTPSNPSTPAADGNMPVEDRLDALANSPLVLPAINTPDVTEHVPLMTLDRPKSE